MRSSSRGGSGKSTGVHPALIHRLASCTCAKIAIVLLLGFNPLCAFFWFFSSHKGSWMNMVQLKLGIMLPFPIVWVIIPLWTFVCVACLPLPSLWPAQVGPTAWLCSISYPKPTKEKHRSSISTTKHPSPPVLKPWYKITAKKTIFLSWHKTSQLPFPKGHQKKSFGATNATRSSTHCPTLFLRDII